MSNQEEKRNNKRIKEMRKEIEKERMKENKIGRKEIIKN